MSSEEEKVEADTVTLEIDVKNHPNSATTTFYRAKHIAYIAGLADKLDHPSSYEGAVTEHLRMSGIYWTYTGLSLLVSNDKAKEILGVTQPKNTSSGSSRPSIVDWVLQCYDKSTGGFGGNVGHEGHLLYTLSAIQILVIADYDLTQLPTDDIIQFVVKLQQPDGSFAGDQWCEIDTRFSYCAMSALSLLGALDKIDISKAVEYIASCQNLDGGFGSMMGAESHAGQVFCCVGALSIAKSLHVIRHPDLLGWWLAERQCDSGGLNGRPEKQADVCYSWWILSVLSILGRMDWISRDKLAAFIANAQDADDGGIADRPEDMPDVFHTFFGLAGLSLLGKLPAFYRKIDPVYALPLDVVLKHKLSAQVISAGSEGAVDERLSHYEILERKK
jgi:geranylgeranyl transferase type-2 subunit beta